MNKKIAIAALSLIILIGMSSLYGCRAKSEETQLIDTFFSCLKSSDYENAGICLGDKNAYSGLSAKQAQDESYLEYQMRTSFLSFIYSSLSYEVLSCNEDRAEIMVSAYDTQEVLRHEKDCLKDFFESADYINSGSGEKYLKTIDEIKRIYSEAENTLTKKENVVVVSFERVGDSLIIKADKSFFDAIGGK